MLHPSITAETYLHSPPSSWATPVRSDPRDGTNAQTGAQLFRTPGLKAGDHQDDAGEQSAVP